MPPKKVTPDEVYVVVSFIWDDDDRIEGLQPVEVYTTLTAANVAAKEMMLRYADELNPLGDVEDYNFNHSEDAAGLYRGELEGGPGGHVAARINVYKSVVSSASPAATKGTLSSGKKVSKTVVKKQEDVVKEEDVEDDDVEEEEEEAPKKPIKKGPPKTAINVQTHRKKIPQGLPNCLEGLKILFTGTFETMDRKTSIATAITYGAEVVSKLEDTDYIVIGIRAGPAKLKKINELELETISEEEFFQILENGIPQEKKDRMANRQLADLEGPEEDDDDEDTKPKKRAAPKSGPAKKRAKR